MPRSTQTTVPSAKKRPKVEKKKKKRPIQKSQQLHKRRQKTPTERARISIANQTNLLEDDIPRAPSRRMQRLVYAVCDMLAGRTKTTRMDMSARQLAHNFEVHNMTNFLGRVDNVRSFANRRQTKTSTMDALVRLDPATLSMFIVPEIPQKAY